MHRAGAAAASRPEGLAVGFKEGVNKRAAPKDRPVAKMAHPAAEGLGELKFAPFCQDSLDLFPGKTAPGFVPVFSGLPGRPGIKEQTAVPGHDPSGHDRVLALGFHRDPQPLAGKFAAADRLPVATPAGEY